ncbi:MAG TPA: hypothetical protein ENH82_05410 [bacterium]|nr:hypothetical protein [bacterium]
MKKQTTIRKRITDLFTNLFKRKPTDKDSLVETHVPVKKKEGKFRDKTRDKWIRIHNQQQAHGANKIKRRRKANKVARHQRQINRKAV